MQSLQFMLLQTQYDCHLDQHFDPELPAECFVSDTFCRSALASTVISFQPGWPTDPQFSVQLLTKLIGDVELLVQTVQSPDAKQLRKFIGFSSCIAAISRVSAQACNGFFPGKQLVTIPCWSSWLSV